MSQFYLSANEADNQCAVAHQKALAQVRATWQAKKNLCDILQGENQPNWEEQRGLQIALHLLENITPEEFYEIAQRGAKVGQPNTDAPRRYSINHNEKLGRELMHTLRRATKAGLWNGPKP